jgi:hypothetical protein
VDGTLGGAGVTDDALLSVTVHLRSQGMNLRDITARLVITTGATKGRHPSPATVMRMLREHDEQKAPRPRRLGPRAAAEGLIFTTARRSPAASAHSAVIAQGCKGSSTGPASPKKACR